MCVFWLILALLCVLDSFGDIWVVRWLLAYEELVYQYNLHLRYKSHTFVPVSQLGFLCVYLCMFVCFCSWLVYEPLEPRRAGKERPRQFSDPAATNSQKSQRGEYACRDTANYAVYHTRIEVIFLSRLCTGYVLCVECTSLCPLVGSAGCVWK